MWIGVLWAGLRVAMWITHVGAKFHHGLLEKSLNFVRAFWDFPAYFLGSPRRDPRSSHSILEFSDSARQ